MDIIRLAISKPVGVAVGVILIVMFGLIGVGEIPVQLTPDVDTPVINVSTTWEGRSPEEIVDRITKEQEERLKNVNGLKSMRSTSDQGQSSITLEFYVGTDIQRALSDVDDALRQVPDYPEDADSPTRAAADSTSENAIAWIIVDLDPKVAGQYPDFDISTLFYELDKEVKPLFERVDGIAEVNIFGGRDREVRILVDPERLALLNVGYDELLSAIRAQNEDISAGTISESKREYPIRVLGQYENTDDVLDTIVAYREGGPIYVRDIAEVEMGHEKSRTFVRSLGHPAIAINAIRQTGANTDHDQCD
ncbi:MAG: efflux RND transporter permease subunit, partial [Planctomycetota bacterium]